MLFEVKATDPLTYFAVLSMAVALAAFACLVPSWRASRTDLKRALRG
jgi:ABC-type lipoprotein release transport system permease subunit